MMSCRTSLGCGAGLDCGSEPPFRDLAWRAPDCAEFASHLTVQDWDKPPVAGGGREHDSSEPRYAGRSRQRSGGVAVVDHAAKERLRLDSACRFEMANDLVAVVRLLSVARDVVEQSTPGIGC